MPASPMSLNDLHRRLVEVARERVRSGEVSERGLARLCGVSQPHMHNVLKEIRSLSIPVADRLLHVLHLRVDELFWCYPGEELGVRAVPVLRNRIGSGTDTSLAYFSGYTPLPSSLVNGLVQPVCGRVAPDLVLPKAFSTNDTILLNQDPAARSAPSGGGCWVISVPGGLRIRYVRLGGGRLYLANEATVHEPAKWDSVLLRDRPILDVIKARIVWASRKFIETELTAA